VKKLNLAAGIFVYLALQGFVYGADIAVRHGFDRSWPAHARYHVVVSGIHIIALSLMTAVAAIGGLRRRRRAAWLTLAVVSTVGWAAWPAARAIAGEPPAGWVQLVTFGSVIAALVALGISYGPVFDGRRAERSRDAEDVSPGRPSAPPVGE
jgi:hypothetical protein